MSLNGRILLSQWKLGAVIAAWTYMVISGSYLMHSYAKTDGKMSVIIQKVPGTSLRLSPHHSFSVVAFLHPKCPCSSATVAALRNLVTRFSEDCRFTVIFVNPDIKDPSFYKTELYESVSKMVDVSVSVDELGVEAKAFGALTSGQMFIYERDGNIRFAGGITSARGLTGVCTAELAVEEILSGSKESFPIRWPVYGCSLL